MTFYCPACGLPLPRDPQTPHYCQAPPTGPMLAAPQKITIRWSDLIWYAATALVVGIGLGALLAAWIFG